MADLPSGVVSFLFTDVEGSTELAGRFGADFAPLMADHFRLTREAVAGHGGVVVKGTGDGVLAAFESPAGAVEAGVAVQQAIANHPWPAGGEVAVRAGVHTGEALVADDDYVGAEVHRAARIMSAAHGGQLLVSGVTRLLVDGSIEFRDLGSHRLKGFEGQEPIFQAVVPGLPIGFPPLRTETAVPNNLPARLTEVIGRDADLAELDDRLASARLVTILGPGGVGKTSVAVTLAGRVADRYPGGVAFVDLSSVTNPRLVGPSIADALGIDSVTIAGIVEHLGSSAVLLVIDNVEQVIEAAPSIGELLAGAPGLAVVLTSQVPSRLPGELRYTLSPLDPSGDHAMRLFEDRARAVAPDFESDEQTTREIVERLGGLPLAIELVAARANLLDGPDILAQLDDVGFVSDTGTARPTRHRSLRDAIDWSRGLLDERTRQAFDALGVFVGSIPAQAVANVLAHVEGVDHLAVLGELVDRSLVNRARTRGRFMMLDGIRQVAGECLADSAAADGVGRRYVEWYLDLGRSAHPGLLGDRGLWWRARLDDELENLREVLMRLHGAERREDGLELLGNTWRFFQSRGHLLELEMWLDGFANLPEEPSRRDGTVRGLMARAAILYWRTDAHGAAAIYREAADLGREVADDPLVAEALYGLGTSSIVAGDIDAGADALRQSRELYEAAGDSVGLADVMVAEAFLEMRDVDGRVLSSKDGRVATSFESAVDLYVEAGRMTPAVEAMYALAALAMREGRLEDAAGSARSGLDKAVELNDVFQQVWGIEMLGRIAFDRGDRDLAGLLTGAAESAVARIGGGWSPATVGLESTRDHFAAELGEVEADALLDTGRDLSVEEAIDALGSW